MAALTWRDVAAPNLGNPQDSINSAAKLLAASTTGMSGALTQFGDQQALQQLAQYSDAQKLQADIQSGRFNTANASGEALAAIMGRPANLIENQTNQQQAAYRKELNPLLIASQGTANEQAGYNLFQDKDGQARLENFTRPNENADRTRLVNVTQANTDVDRSRADALWNRTEDTRKLLDTAQVDVNTRLTDGSLNTVNQARDLLKTLSTGPKEVTDFYTKALSTRFPDLIAAPVASPLSSGIGSFGSNISVPGVTGGTVAGTGTSVGERNNNQGNLMGTGWVTSMPGYLGNDDKGFAKFATNDQGTAANNHQLERYWEGTQATGGKPVRTIDGIINTWAPPESATAKTGNSVESVANYKKYVQTRTGIDMTKELTKEQLGPVRAAMQEFETGNKPTNVPTAQQLSNTSASSIALNNMAKVGANTPEVERWLGATATPGNGSAADVANELKKGSLASVPLNRIQEMLHQTASKTETTGDYRLAGEILKSSLTGDSTFRFGFGSDTFGFNPDFSDKLVAANIDKYKTRSKTTDSIQAGRTLDQGSAALLEAQKQVEALKAYSVAKKNELAKGVFGVTQADVTQADTALQQALATSVQIQDQVANFRPKTNGEVKPPVAAPASATGILAANATTAVKAADSDFYAKQKAAAEASLKFKQERRKAEQAAEEAKKRQEALDEARIAQRQADYVREQIRLRKERAKS